MPNIERLADGTVLAGSNLIFDTVVYSSGNVAYNAVTGLITLNETGRYDVNWWVATQTIATADGAIFTLFSSQGDFLEGNSPNKTGEVVGFALSISPALLSPFPYSMPAEAVYS